MKSYLLRKVLFVIILSSTSILSVQSYDTLSIKNNKSIDSMKIQLSNLTNELNTYRNNEKYFDAMLNEQATRFSLIIACIISLVGLVTYGSYRIEITRIKKEVQSELKSQNEILTKFKDNYKNIELNLNLALANMYRISSIEAESKKDIYNQFYWTLKSMFHGASIYLSKEQDETVKKKAYGNIKNHLIFCISQFDKLPNDGQNKDKLVADKSDIIFILDEIEKTITSDEIKIATASLKIKILNYLNASS